MASTSDVFLGKTGEVCQFSSVNMLAKNVTSLQNEDLNQYWYSSNSIGAIAGTRLLWQFLDPACNMILINLLQTRLLS